jgi:RNA 2',3'-cyclic 3'-phosphodiesterase
MRLFTGIAIPRDVLTNIDQLLAELRPLAPVKWSPVENLHITTKFIGQWPEPRLAELERTLGSIETPPPFSIAISRFGYLPNPHHPKVFFAGIQAPPELAHLARSIDGALAPLGIAREDRPYTPHLTLARIKNENIRTLREHIAKMTNFDFGTFPASEFHLYLSKPGAQGSVYTRLASFPLRASSGSQASGFQE